MPIFKEYFVDEKSPRDRIIKMGAYLYLTRGIRKTTMDHVSGMLGVSKRTVYELFHGKEDLLYASIKAYKEYNHKRAQEIVKNAANFMDSLLYFDYFRRDQLLVIDSNFFMDVPYYKRTMEFLIQSRETDAQFVEGYLKKGVEEGYILPDVNLRHIFQLEEMMINSLVVKYIKDRRSLTALHQTFSETMLRGICTEKGREYLERFFACKAPGRTRLTQINLMDWIGEM